MSADATVRVEDFGRLVREVPVADFADALQTAIQLAREYPRFWVSPYRPDNIDLGAPEICSTCWLHAVDVWRAA